MRKGIRGSSQIFWVHRPAPLSDLRRVPSLPMVIQARDPSSPSALHRPSFTYCKLSVTEECDQGMWQGEVHIPSEPPYGSPFTSRLLAFLICAKPYRLQAA